MDTATRRTKGVQRGPRSHQVVESVRKATMSELARVGFAGLTIDGVAKAANVNRTTIYRRWPSKGALLAAVIEPLLERFDDSPDTGTLYGDLLAVMLTLREFLALPEGQALSRAVESSSGELKALVDRTTDRALAAFRRTFDRARARGEIGPAADAEMIAHLAFYGLAVWENNSDGGSAEQDCHRILRIVLAPVPGVLP